MSNVKFVLNKEGVRELMKSDEMREICSSHAAQVQQRAGTGYIAEDRSYPERAGAAVRADTFEARKDNLENNTLLKSLY